MGLPFGQNYKNFVAITPSDTVDLNVKCQAIMVGVTGNVSVISQTPTETGALATPATLVLTAGVIYEILPKRIRATGTTATGIVALSF